VHSTLSRLILVFLAMLLAASCTEYGYTTKTNRDVFQQVRRNTVDVLLVVDNSCSMWEEQDKLASNFQDFIDAFEGIDVDWQLAVVTTDMYSPNFSGRFLGGTDEIELQGPTGRTLDRVAFASVFTTQDPNDEMARMADRTHHGLPMPVLDQKLTRIFNSHRYTAWMGRLHVPNWQQGEYPYLIDGGGFAFDEDGWPELAGWSDIEFVLSVPPDDPPEGGWPVVIWMDGTGSDATTFADENTSSEPAAVLAKAGLAGLSISLPFHGDRNTGGDPSLLSFNYSNPEAGRANFRQAALEQVYLADLLSAHAHHFTGDGLDFTVDPDRIAYMGHSHGAEIGSLAVPFFAGSARSVVLSGAGGGLALSVVYRDAGDFDIQSLLESTFEFDDGEVLDETHPLVGMIQLVSEVTDPLNYAPYWWHTAPRWEGQPTSVLQFEGLEDIYTPPLANEALAGAAHTPILEPVGELSTVQDLAGEEPQPTPCQGNRTGWDGTAVTAGLAQYTDQGHFVVFYDADAADLYGSFLETSMQGEATIGAR